MRRAASIFGLWFCLILSAAPAAAQSQLCEQAHAEPDLAKSLELFTQCLQSPSLDHKYLLLGHLGRGQTLHELGRDQEAMDDYNQAIALEPTQPWCFILRGEAYHELGQDDLAVQDLNQAVQLDPKDADAYAHRGELYYDLNRDEDALADYNRALQLDPNNAHAYGSRANVLRTLQRYGEALQDFDMSLSLDPDNEASYNNRGLVYADLGRWREAVADYDQAIRLDPSDARFYGNRGEAQEHLRHYAEAIQDYAKALEIAPDTFWICAGSAWLLATCPDTSLTDGPRAVALAEKASAHYNDADSLDTLAAAYARAGRFAEAVKTAEQALAMAGQEQQDQKLQAKYQSRLDLYRQGRPYTATP